MLQIEKKILKVTPGINHAACFETENGKIVLIILSQPIHKAGIR
jgi:hypothetical protein